LTKLDKVVKLLHGENLWYWCTLSFHHWAVLRKSQAALIICLNLSLIAHRSLIFKSVSQICRPYM
jgi:hypothetical protein